MAGKLMRVSRFQHTLRHKCHVSGRGYWTGCPVSLVFHPAEPNTGIVFRRVDLPGEPTIQALACNRTETALRTRLRQNNAVVDMVEHVMAALYGMQIDNCIVDVNTSEMPGLDGSAYVYAAAIQQAGVEVQPAPREMHVIEHPLRIGDDQQWITAMPSAFPSLTIEYRLDYGDKSPIGAATVTAELDPDTFFESISPARTFILESEASSLQAKGLARHVTYRDLLVFGDRGSIDNTLRFSDECARHKLLDLIGDLALSGKDIAGRITACRSGHILNGRMAETLTSQSSAAKVFPNVA